MNDTSILILFAVLGLVVGSFLNVLIIRIPKGENIAYPSSHCVKCNNKLKWYHNIPLFSWLFLKGRCAYCHEPISWQYPLIELTTMFIFIVSFLRVENITQSVIVALIFSLLLALSLIDFRFKEVPDSLNLSALTLSVFATGDIILGFQNALLFAGAFTLLRFYISYALKKEAMGEADIMIAGTIGAMLGINLGLFAIFFSAVLALVAFMIVQKKDIEMPYIPFLAAALFIVFIFEDFFSALMERLYG